MVFETKKLQREILSEYLQEIRASHELSIEEVAQRTGIQSKFISYLETAQFEKLPPDVYVTGFLKNLAQLYGTSTDVLIEQFKKERAMVDPKNNPRATSGATVKDLLKNVIVTPKLVSVGVGVLFLVITIGYIFFQVAAINSPPVLQVNEPKAGQVISDSVVVVSGKTEPGTVLKINDQTIFVNADGDFKTNISVTSGQKELVFTAKDKFDNEVRQTVSVVVNQPQVAGEVIQEETTVTVEVDATAPITVTIIRDGDAPSTERLGTGIAKQIEAKKQVSISTSDAGSTSVTVNGKKIGALGRKGERLDNVVFSKDSADALDLPTTTNSNSNTPKQ